MKGMYAMGLLAFLLIGSGCAHQVAFQDVDYRIDELKRDEPVSVLIEPAERARTVSIRSFMAGAAHSWEAEPGQMLMQVADVELPQWFAHYKLVDQLPENGGAGYILELSVPEYRFESFRASVGVQARFTAMDGQELLERLYRADGPGRGGRMFWGGAFAMKSAMRTSSLEAFKEVFSRLREDLNQILDSVPSVALGESG